MKKFKIYFWISTILLVLFEGVMPLFSYDTELAREGIRHLGYPAYFGTALVVFKVLGCVLLIIPNLPPRVKEWAYAGFTFDFVFACISHSVVDGMGVQTVFPLVILAILIISYVNYHRLLSAEKTHLNDFKTNHFQSPVNG